MGQVFLMVLQLWGNPEVKSRARIKDRHSERQYKMRARANQLLSLRLKLDMPMPVGRAHLPKTIFLADQTTYLHPGWVVAMTAAATTAKA
jgi:hypothetical protein